MDLGNEHIADTAIAIFNNFEIDGPAEKLPEEKDPWTVLRSILAEKIRYWIEKEPEKLKYVLYRIDVNEQKVMNVLAHGELTEAIDSIAQMIIERQLEKVETRKKYASNNGDLSWDIEP